jgi:GTP pyrophosphokinase
VRTSWGDQLKVQGLFATQTPQGVGIDGPDVSPLEARGGTTPPIKPSERFIDALAFAARRHADQLRKGTHVPYIAHLLGVTSIVLEYGATEEEAIGALLHDAVEDQKATLREISARFGKNVAEIVAGCSDTDVDPKPPWRPRKEAYIAHVRSAKSSVQLVSAADKLHNARSIVQDYRAVGEAVWQRFNGGRDGTLWYYRALASAFMSTGSPLAAELDQAVSELEELATRAEGAPRTGPAGSAG